MLQRELAKLLVVDPATITNWEKGHTKPPLRYLPKIIQFLGYSPLGDEQKTLGEKLLIYRPIQGIKQKDLARRIGIDPATLSRIERVHGKSLSPVQDKVNSYLRKTEND